MMDTRFLGAAGTAAKIVTDDGNVVVTAGKIALHELHKFYAIASGRIELADGTPAWAILELDPSSSMEHGGTGIFLPDGTLVFQNEPRFAEAMEKFGKKSEDIFPYRYSYGPNVPDRDHHVGDDGWSSPPTLPVDTWAQHEVY